MAEGDETEKKPETTETETAADESYGARISKAATWAVGALAAAASFAVASLGFEQISEGAWDGAQTWALVGAVLLISLGVSAVVGGVFWIARADRVTLQGLQDGKPGSTLKKVRERIEGAPHLIDGKTSIKDFQTDIGDLVKERATGPVAFQSDADKRLRLKILISAKGEALKTARAERVAIVSSRATILMVLGVALATTGAALLAVGVGQAQTRQEAVDRVIEREELTLEGVELVPAPLTAGYLRYPTGKTTKADLVKQLGPTCKSGVKGTIIEVGTPPSGTASTRVVRFLVPRSDTCRRAELWVSPAWLSAEAPAGTDKPGASSTTTTTAAEPATPEADE